MAVGGVGWSLEGVGGPLFSSYLLDGGEGFLAIVSWLQTVSDMVMMSLIKVVSQYLII